MDFLDVLIVGGGPAGLSAAVILGRARRRVVVVDAGRPRNAAARAMHGFLTRDGVNPKDFLNLARTELRPYGVEFLADEVDAVELLDVGQGGCKTLFAASTKGGRRFQARKILFATGTCDDVPNLPGVAECYGVTVHHCPYCDGWEHRDKRLVSFSFDPKKGVGLGLLLRGWSERVTVLTHGAEASLEERRSAEANGLSIIETPIVRLVHEGSTLRGLEFDDGRTIDADALFFNAGQTQTCDLPRRLGCEMESSEHLEASDKQRSTVPGVFLAGDAEGDVQFVIVAAAEGAKAAVVINKELQAEERREDGVSAFPDSRARND
jgi:thioredoxin reductase